MMRSRPRTWRMAAAGGCLLLGLASAARGQALAKVTASPDGLAWRPAREGVGLSLTVSGPGIRFERAFEPGQSARFAVRDRGTGSRPDGPYSWELRATLELDVATRKGKSRTGVVDAQGREVGLETKRKLEDPILQAGSFSILDGKVVNPTEKEALPGRDPRREGGIEVEGDLTVEGRKMFRAADPATRSSIVYVALEGPEAGTYLRGSAETIDGEAIVDLPTHFAKVTEDDGLTVQLTTLGRWSQLYVAEATPGRLVIRDAESRDAVAFDYFVQGVRKGFADHRVERPADADFE